jgi:hypothetical protein
MEEVAFLPCLAIAEKAPARVPSSNLGDMVQDVERGRNWRKYPGRTDCIKLVFRGFWEVNLMVQEVNVKFFFTEPPVSCICASA